MDSIVLFNIMTEKTILYISDEIKVTDLSEEEAKHIGELLLIKLEEIREILDDSDYKRVGKIGFIIHEKKQNGKK